MADRVKESNPLTWYYEPPEYLSDLLYLTARYMENVVWKNCNKIVYLGVRLIYELNMPALSSAPMGKKCTRSITKHNQQKSLYLTYPGWCGKLFLGLSSSAAYSHRKWLAKAGKNINTQDFASSFSDVGIHVLKGGRSNKSDLPEFAKKKLSVEYSILPELPYAYQWDVEIWPDDWPHLQLSNLIKPTNLFSPDYMTETWYFNFSDTTPERYTTDRDILVNPVV